jgi:phage baseplate assembly protein W
MATARTFSDIDLRFNAHPVTGDIVPLTDVDAIKASVRNLILTQFFERKWHSEIGSQVNGLLFENHSPLLDVLLKRAITNTIDNFEPRVKLIDVYVNAAPDNNAVYIQIEFRIINTERPITLDLVIERSR